jgi:hypothetical protein
MLSQADIKAMEDIIVEHAGPLGKFVIKKVIQDIGTPPSDFTDDTKNKFIQMVLERSIFDPMKHKPVRAQIFKAWRSG